VNENRDRVRSERRQRLYELLAVAGLTCLAACLRFYALDRLPPGLYHDEAFNGLDALRVLQGERPIYFAANNGREPLFIYLVAASIALWGRTPGAIRFVSACVGTLTVPATYLMAKEMFGRRTGFLTAALMAITFWPLNLSRIGFRAVAMPLFTALTLWSFWRGWRRNSPRAMIAAGLFCGLGFYTYLASRFTIAVWALLGAYALLKRRGEWRKLVPFALTALLVTAPLLCYGMGHYEAFLKRAGQISVFASEISGGDPWGTLLRQGIRSALMFVYRGDFIPRHNMPYRPVFGPLIAPFFVVGLALSLGQLRRGAAHAFTLAWLGIMLLPTALAEGAPHFLRAVGVLPVACVLPALGLEAGYRFLDGKALRLAARGLLSLLLMASAALTVRDYFGRHVSSEDAYYNFEAGATELAARVNRFLGRGWDGQGMRASETRADASAKAYLDRRLWEGWPSLRYLIPPEGLSIWSKDMLPAGSTSATSVMVVCWPYADYKPALALLPGRAIIEVEEGSEERGDLEQEARLLYIAYTGERTEEVPRNIEQRFQRGIVLLGYSYRFLAPTELRINLYWQADSAVAENWTVFAHARRGERMIGQDDAPPAKGYYPTSYWRPGDIVVDEHTMTLSAPYLAEQDKLWAGLYKWETQERLQLLDAAGDPGGDHVTIRIPYPE